MLDDKPRYRWYQYSLRTLLLLMLLASLGMSAFATRMRTARRQRDAVAAIQRSGGSVWYNHDCLKSGFYSIRRADSKPGPQWLRRLLGDDFFMTVVEAAVESDADFENLKQLDQLNRLHCGTKVTKAGLEHLRELHQLRNLNLWSNRVVGTAWEHITALAELEELDLYCADVGDAEVERLDATMTRLRFLGLGGTKVTDAGLRHLDRLTRLEELRLNDTQIGDAGVEHLKGLKQLKRLSLQGTRITDGSLRHLASLKHLVRLELQETNLSAAAVWELWHALPGCDIATIARKAGDPGELPELSDPFSPP